MKKLVKALLLYTCSISAIVYENGEDRTTKKWELYNSVSKATVKNIYDKDKKSRVLYFKSDDIRNGYMLPMERNSKSWCQTNGKSLKWSMSSSDDFVILVSLQTIDGHRYIIYTPSSDKMGRGYYGLGKSSIDGSWHKFHRDLNLDLKRYEPNNEIIAVDTFFVRGKDIKIDDVEIVSIKKRDSIPKKPKDCKIYLPTLNSKTTSTLNRYDDTPPVIKLNGASTVYIKLGQEYKEMGAVAIDNVDGALNVDISGDIDTNRVGTYTLFYMTKDKTGNTSMTTRVVNVKGVPTHSVMKKVKKTEKKHIKVNKDKIKSVKDLELELAIPPEDEALEEFGIVGD
jgi:hypothetical protein